jgi:hypothetical protein
MTLTAANAVGTPGVKDPDPDYRAIKENEIEPVTGFTDSVDSIYAFSSKMGRLCLSNAVRPDTGFKGQQNANSVVGLSLDQGIVRDCDLGTANSHDKHCSQDVPTRARSDLCASTCALAKSRAQRQLFSPARADLKVRCSNSVPDMFNTVPYSKVYGTHPSLLKATAEGFRQVPSNSDPYTSKSGAVMADRAKRQLSAQRIAGLKAAKEHRRQIIEQWKRRNPWLAPSKGGALEPRLQQDKDHRVLDEVSPKELALTSEKDRRLGPDVHKPGASLSATLARLEDKIFAKTKPAYKGPPGAKRKGAKAVKKMERAANAEFVLSRDEATMYRALAARANFLSQDRPDINFSTKELCREFSEPNQKSYLKLKRLVRYLLGLPRLVYDFPFLAKGEIPSKDIDLYVDTDFAGCRETRRSTSGGVALIGGRNVKHWSKTQSTIALSSGEAELNGIGQGIAQGLGVQSICRDLGYDYGLRVHTDATAAIGIARRRGMGKIRHLDTTDLWIQEVVRSGRVELLKVLGAENPADILTKYVERPLIQKMLAKMGMLQLSGRAKCAPEIAAKK